MGLWDTLFNSGDTLDKATDAVINTGDKLFYTDEEKAEDRIKQREFFPTLLKAYHPFKIAQRVLAMWFGGLFGLAFIVGLFVSIFNMISTYKQTVAGIAKEEIVIISLNPLFALVNAFSLGLIMLTIVGFYFAGGAINSLHKDK